MKNPPVSTLPLTHAFLRKSSGFLGISGMDPDRRPAAPQRSSRPEAFGITAVWAQHQDDVRAAQRLRYGVFAGEMGARLDTTANADYPGHDIDLFDDYCEHLLVRDRASQEVVGTYRVLTPTQAKRVGSTYTDTAFDLTRLRAMRARMVELGRSCVHRDFRHGGVTMALGGTLFQFMVRNQFDSMIGCAHVPLSTQGEAAGSTAARIWNQVRRAHLAPIEHLAFPRRPLPLERMEGSRELEPPALIRGLLRLGARVLGPPAWDPTLNSADLPIMARLEDLPTRYRKHFVGV